MIDCLITSRNNTISYKNIKGVKLPSVYGEIEVLSNHAKAFIILKQGDIVIKKSESQEKRIKIDKGECYIRNDIVSIII